MDIQHRETGEVLYQFQPAIPDRPFMTTVIRKKELASAALSGQAFNRCDITDSNLSDASFAQSTFTQTRLNRNNLRDTDWTEADVDRVYVLGSDLSGATLTAAKLHRVITFYYNRDTIWPEDFDPNDHHCVLQE
jgi:uncharacterized protein YjbI with pentapeptide repeats